MNFAQKNDLSGKQFLILIYILRSHQEPVLEAIKNNTEGVILAPPGSGKTIIGSMD